MKKLSQLIFNNSYRHLPAALGTPLQPQPLSAPFLVSINPQISHILELDPEQASSEQFINVFTGNETLNGFEPIAMKYTGHQFGQYNPDLGDGRGLLLGEIVTSQGKKWDLHLKGSGLTPYSRQGDGRAVLRSSIREYLASAAMAGLGIKTTHALAILSSNTPVYRETIERGATLVRVAESHLRFGHFEYLFYTNQHAELKILADYLIKHHFPAINSETSDDHTRYSRMFQQIVALTATMIADWQAAGFAHGVMNTDNMSVLGLTFDYGPYGFMDDYNQGYICNASDYAGRYAFNQQPSIALWNLAALGYALTPLISKDIIELTLDSYQPIFQSAYSQKMRDKLGLQQKQAQDTPLFAALFQLMGELHIDHTLFFRTLSTIPKQQLSSASPLFSELVTDIAPLAIWLNHYAKRLEVEQQPDPCRLVLMRNSNPKYILRNYLAQQAIDKADSGDFSMIEQLLTVLNSPYQEHRQFKHFAELPPQWGKELKISCSS
ncbi:protein adenylyltransferase SelO [Photobacterium nomapromontoriensis]|uniref:protein adenylyltransferase SelO n=1 Tax=Photobacterium nomapromontoriensis TaxID=2910237 RepID=UPI003D1369A4